MITVGKKSFLHSECPVLSWRCCQQSGDIGWGGPVGHRHEGFHCQRRQEEGVPEPHVPSWKGVFGVVGVTGSSVKIHRRQHGWASPERWKEGRATRRHYDCKAELSPEKTHSCSCGCYMLRQPCLPANYHSNGSWRGL